MDIVTQIIGLFNEFKEARCGESITVLQHSLYSAQLAVKDEQGYSLIAACLLHDVGHLLHLHTAPFDKHEDDFHADKGANFLKGHFPAEVVEPIRLHVAAKRYLCTIDRHYFTRLSDAAKLRFHVQGGSMEDDECKTFHESPWSYDAIMLRRYDDRAKHSPPDKLLPLSEYEPILRTLSNDLQLKIA